MYGHVHYTAESKEGKKDERNQGTKNWKKKLTTKNGESERKKRKGERWKIFKRVKCVRARVVYVCI